MNKEYLEILTVDDYIELKKELNKKFQENLHLLDISGYLEIIEIMSKYNKDLKFTLHHYNNFVNKKNKENLSIDKENLSIDKENETIETIDDNFKPINQYDFNEKNALVFYNITEKNLL
jgi:maltose-binding protein MalE